METNQTCKNCPRACHANRGNDLGFCNESNEIRIAKTIKNFQWEEPCITGEKGTLAIFFSGCNLRCDYCQNHEISKGGVGKLFSIDDFCKFIEENQANHSSIDLITPTHFSETLYAAFKKIDKKIPVIWNTNSYETVENIRKVSGFVDVFLADFKYGDNNIGKTFSKCSDYLSVAKQAIAEMCKQKTDLRTKGFLNKGVIIRHLVLPGNAKNSLKVLDIIKSDFPDRIISIMSQFTPNGKSSLDRKLNPIEYKTVLKHLEKLNLTNGYVQEFESADTGFIPKFV